MTQSRNEQQTLSYKQAGVDIDVADATKRDMADALRTADPRVLNRIGAFASLFDARFPGYTHPVLVLKTEEPGSKQKLAFATTGNKSAALRSICADMVNHLINDIVVMGATPLTVQDAIICGHLEKSVINDLVAGIGDACRAEGCSLVGGETSEQPGVLEKGLYILTSSVVGVVEHAKIIDGSKIAPGDEVLAIPSSGPHTNGYSLIRALLASKPEIATLPVGSGTFFDAIMVPHTCYNRALRPILDQDLVTGLAHITGGGIPGNLNRILPSSLDAEISLAQLRVLPVFSAIKKHGQVPDADMLRTFNLGVGMTVVCRPNQSARIIELLKPFHEVYRIGVVKNGSGTVTTAGTLCW